MSGLLWDPWRISSILLGLVLVSLVQKLTLSEKCPQYLLLTDFLARASCSGCLGGWGLTAEKLVGIWCRGPTQTSFDIKWECRSMPEFFTINNKKELAGWLIDPGRGNAILLLAQGKGLRISSNFFFSHIPHYQILLDLLWKYIDYWLLWTLDCSLNVLEILLPQDLCTSCLFFLEHPRHSCSSLHPRL